MRIRAWAEVADHFTITDPRCVDALSPFYVWSTDYAEKRLEWKRRHPLHVLLLRTYRIPRPVTVRVKDEYGGCRSWLELQRDLPFEGTPVLSDDEFERAADDDPRDRQRRHPGARLSAASCSRRSPRRSASSPSGSAAGVTSSARSWSPSWPPRSARRRSSAA